MRRELEAEALPGEPFLGQVLRAAGVEGARVFVSIGGRVDEGWKVGAVLLGSEPAVTALERKGSVAGERGGVHWRAFPLAFEGRPVGALVLYGKEGPIPEGAVPSGLLEMAACLADLRRRHLLLDFLMMVPLEIADPEELARQMLRALALYADANCGALGLVSPEGRVELLALRNIPATKRASVELALPKLSARAGSFSARLLGQKGTAWVWRGERRNWILWLSLEPAGEAGPSTKGFIGWAFKYAGAALDSAFQMRRLREEMVTRAAYLAALYDLDADIRRHLTLQERVEGAVSIAYRILQAEGAIMVVTREDGSIEMVRGEPADLPRSIPREEIVKLLERARREGSFILGGPKGPAYFAKLGEPKKFLGMVGVYRPALQVRASELREMVVTLASYVSTAIERVRLLERLKRRVEEAETLYRSLYRMGAAESEAEVGEEGARAALKLLGGSGAFVYLRGREGLEELARAGETEGRSEEARLLALRATAEREAVAGEEGLAAPIRRDRRLLGALAVLFDPPRRAREEEKATARMLAAQLGLALSQVMAMRQLRRARERERRLRARLERLAESPRVGVVGVDGRGRIFFINRRAEELLGVDREEAVGRRFYKVYKSAGVGEPERCPLFAALRTGKVADVEDLEGTPPLRLTVLPFESPEEGAMVIVEDLTEKRRLLHLEELNRLKSEFVLAVSHEIRMPLSAIVGFSELLLKREFPPEERKRMLSTIRSEALHISALVSDLLDLARIETGGWRPKLAEVEVVEAARRAVEAARGLTDRHSFSVRAEGGVPPALADETALDRIFRNLLGNAVKFSPSGGEISISIRLWRGEEGDPLNERLRDAKPPQVVVSVSDQGVGISPDRLSKIFEPFVATPSPDGRRGAGLGLALVRRLVEAQGGRVWAESRPGRGSTFYFTLPAAKS